MEIKNLFKIIVLFLSLLFFSVCFTADLLDKTTTDYDTKIETEKDKISFIGKFKTDRRFAVIGNKYIYVINDKVLNNFLENNLNSFEHYYLDKNYIDVEIIGHQKGNINFI